MDSYSKALEKIKYDQKCKPSCCVGPTARCNKSSIYIFKW